MQKLMFLLIFFLVNLQPTFALKSALYPEDGSLPMNYWYYAAGEVGPSFPQDTLTNIENAFRAEGVEPVIWPKYEWMQDLLFFNQDGQFVELPDLPKREDYFDDVTIGIFESWGQYDGKLNRLSMQDFQTQKTKSVDQLKVAFLEGGATITGRFENGEDYIILNHARVKNLAKTIPSKNIIQELAKDLNLKEQNVIVLKGINSQHLDLYIKALPNGVLLIDDPSQRMTIAKQYIHNRDVLEQISDYELSDHYKYAKESYSKSIRNAKAQLEKRFKLIPIAGRFIQKTLTSYGSVYKKEEINFFNSVSGTNKISQRFYITNDSPEAPGIKDYIYKVLAPYGFTSEHIHFVGSYLNGSGLDCMGSPTI